MQNVRRIDLRDAEGDEAKRRSFRDTLLDGLVETGFVRVAGHGVGDALVARTHALYADFFALEQAEKQLVGGLAGGQRGFTPFGVEHARDSARPDQKEFFHVGQEPAPDSPLRGVYPENVWPDAPAGLRETSMTLYRELERVAGTLLREIALAFGLSPDRFSSMIVEGNSILRAAHYPPEPEGADPHAMRAAPHEDINLVTLLCHATDEGLELLPRSGEWMAVEGRPGEIVADVGDMLARITNGRLPATTHRVVARGEAAGRHRYALPFFAHPRPECDLSVLPAFVREGERPHFPPITAQVFLEERLREIGLIS